MPSTPTTRLRLNKQATGDNPNAWGDALNTVLDLLDEAAGVVEIAVNGNVTLTANNYASDQSRRSVLRFTGAGGFNVVVPTIEKMWFIDNRCTAAVTLKTASTAGSSVLPGTKRIAYCDGATITTDTSSTAPSATDTAFNSTTSLPYTNVQEALAAVGGRGPGVRNRFNDPGFRIAQENGSTLLTPANGSNVYVTDTSQYTRSHTAGTVTVQRLTLVTPGGSPNRIRTSVTATNTPGASEHSTINWKIEGADIHDLQFGYPAGKSCVIRLGIRCNTSGTFTLSVRNGLFNRSYLTQFTIGAGEIGTDVLRTFVIPPDTTGTWYTDSQVGMIVSVNFSSGSTFTSATANAWQAGNYLAVSGSTNLLGVNGAALDVFDLGVYEGTIVPPFELRPYDEDLRAVQRQYVKTYHMAELPGAVTANYFIGATTEASSNYFTLPSWNFPVQMRAQPSLISYSPATGAVSAIRNINTSTDIAASFAAANVNGCVVGANNVNIAAQSAVSAHIVANARL